MTFSTNKTIGEVLKQHQIYYQESNFLSESEFYIPDYFRDDLETVILEGVVNNSKLAICQNLIYPVLKLVWKTKRQKFILWSHQPLNDNGNLLTIPEYTLAKHSPLGKVVFDKPYFILVETVEDKFAIAWSQCLSNMITAQRLNGEILITIFGIVSDGYQWQFAKLENNLFTKNKISYGIHQLDKLLAIINYVFQECELQLDSLTIASI
jgi:hypothetical protein